MKFITTLFLVLTTAVSLVLFAESSEHTDDVLVRALQDEMERSLTELQIDDEPKPYFVAYTVDEVSVEVVQSILGATADSNRANNRTLSVTLRVGDRKLDNTNFAGAGSGGLFGGLIAGFGSEGTFPLTDSYDELRRIIWMRTDAAYKDAVSALAAKKTALEQQPSLERADDFNVEEPFEYVSDHQVATIENDRLQALANELSNAFKGYPELQRSSTTASYVTNTRTYIDSDGNFHRLKSSLCSVRSTVTAQAEDGAIVNDYVTVHASDCEHLNDDIARLKQRQVDLVTTVREFISAEHIQSYTGPVLMVEEASASFFSQVLGSRAGASPLPVSDAPGMNVMGGLQNPFLDKIGARVLPNFLSVVNDPTQREYEGVTLLGSYVVDREGIPAQRTDLIQEGRLEALLTTRAPVKEFEKSTGSNRQGAPLPGNLFVSATEHMTEEELKRELLMWVEDSGNEFGILIKRFNDLESIVTGASFDAIVSLSQSAMLGGIPLLPTLRTYKVDLEGNEVPIRPLTVQSFSDRQMRDIVAVSDTPRAYNVSAPFTAATLMSAFGGALGGLSTPTFIGVVAPSILLEELTLQGGSTGYPRVPIVSHPASN